MIPKIVQNTSNSSAVKKTAIINFMLFDELMEKLKYLRSNYPQQISDSLEHLDVPELDKNQTTTTPALAAALSAYRLSDQTVRSKIVDILLIEPNLINEWVAFCGWLGIPEVELVQWRPQYMVAIMSKYELLSKILSVWGSREGGKANVAILIKVLNDHKFLTESSKWFFVIC